MGMESVPKTKEKPVILSSPSGPPTPEQIQAKLERSKILNDRIEKATARIKKLEDSQIEGKVSRELEYQRRIKSDAEKKLASIEQRLEHKKL